MTKLNWNEIQEEAKKVETKRMKERLWTQRIVRIVAIILLVLVISGSVWTYFTIHNALSPVDANSQEPVEVTIPIGSTSGDIAQILAENQLTSSSQFFNLYMKFKGSHAFQAGHYEFTKSMNADQLLKTLEEGGEPIFVDVDTTLTVVEGMQLEEIAEMVAENTSIEAEEFLKTANDPQFREDLEQSFPSLLNPLKEIDDLKYPLEGYLFPATYDYIAGMTSQDLIKAMVGKSNLEYQKLSESLANTSLTYHQVLTLASIVEREAVTDEDRALVAGVFLNRLSNGMPLQSDITVSYALGEHKELITYQDLEVDSPYNTYKVEALPPGPINSPSLSSIQSVLTPTYTSYLYFVADMKTGEIYYSETQEEHDALVEQYVQPFFDEATEEAAQE